MSDLETMKERMKQHDMLGAFSEHIIDTVIYFDQSTLGRFFSYRAAADKLSVSIITIRLVIENVEEMADRIEQFTTTYGGK